MSSFKRSQRKYVNRTYRVRNWREYEAGLRDPGEPYGLDYTRRRQAYKLGCAQAQKPEARSTAQVLGSRD
jgi:hypothetical protein